MKKNNLDYTLLVLSSALYLGTVVYLRGNPYYVLASSGLFALTYFFWGIFHHLRTSTFHARIMLEYFLVALLGLVVVSTLVV